LRPLLAKGVSIYAEPFALFERGIARDWIVDGVVPTPIEALVDLLAEGRPTLWFCRRHDQDDHVRAQRSALRKRAQHDRPAAVDAAITRGIDVNDSATRARWRSRLPSRTNPPTPMRSTAAIWPPKMSRTIRSFGSATRFATTAARHRVSALIAKASAATIKSGTGESRQARSRMT
jgi:hypothetical protein